MTPERDFDGQYRIDDYPQGFSSEADAHAAIEFAIEVVGREANKERPYRYASHRAYASAGDCRVATGMIKP